MLASVLFIAAAPATYFVSPGRLGADTNPGTAATSPFRTLAHAVSKLKPGDKLFLMDGEYPADKDTGLALIIKTSGGGFAPIRISAAPQATPRLRGGVRIEKGVEDVLFQGISLVAAKPNEGFGLEGQDEAEVSWAGGRIEGFAVGVETSASARTYLTGVTFLRNRRHAVRAVSAPNGQQEGTLQISESYFAENGTAVEAIAGDGSGQLYARIQNGVFLNQTGVALRLNRLRDTMLTNLTMVDNGGGQNPAVVWTNSVRSRFVNSIVVGRRDAQPLVDFAQSGIRHEFNLYWRGSVEVLGPTEVQGDPRLIARVAQDSQRRFFGLAKDSPAIGIGTTEDAPSIDFLNQKREGAMDLGAVRR